MILTDISVIGPEYTPPKPPQPLSPAQPWLRQCDRKLLEHLHAAGSSRPVWSLLNVVADEQGPRDRTAGRLLRLELLGRLKRLRRLGLAFSVGRNWISASKPDPAARLVTGRRRRPTVAGSRPVRVVSADTGSGRQKTEMQPLTVRDELHNEQLSPLPPTPDLEKTQSAPAPEFVSEAARRLARLPRRPRRRWSGLIGSVRSYRNLPVLLPGGERAYAFGARRGLLVYVREPGMCAGDPDLAGQSWGVVPASSVRIIKNEHAARLGRLKAGKAERKSEAKARAARLNGLRPCREGKRRGRPSSGNQYPLSVSSTFPK